MKTRFFIPFFITLPLIFLMGCRSISDNKTTKIDITGNWKDENGYPPYIQTREKKKKKGEFKTFSQVLTLPKGNYRILFEYDQRYGVAYGVAIDDNKTYDSLSQARERQDSETTKDNKMVFNGFTINEIEYSLIFSPDSVNKRIYRAEKDFVIEDSVKTLKLNLKVQNTRVMRTILTGSFRLGNRNYFAVDPGITREYLMIRGIPFLARKSDIRHDAPWFGRGYPDVNADRGSLKIWDNGMSFNLGGTKVNKLHFLGMIHKIDVANGSWFSRKGDHGYSHFLGDEAGEIILTLKNKERISIPLIFGFNLWYSRPWDLIWYGNFMPDHMSPVNHDKTLFSGDESYRDLVQNTLSLVDGMRLMGSGSNNTRFIFSVDLENKPVQTIEIKGVEEMYGHPLISAITVETAEPSSVLSPLPELGKNITGIKPVSIQYVSEEEYKLSLEKLKRVIYTYKDEMPELKEPVIPENYFGPRYDFQGTREAVYAATYLYRNGPECGAKIADNGTGCSSSIARKQNPVYTFGTGIWIERPSLFGSLQNWFRLYQEKSPGNLPGVGNAWSRGIGELMREAMAFGYGKFINTYTDWLDSCLYEANPPHWNRVPGQPDFVSTKKRMVGHTEERGNRENDGHGICMWGRYMVYHWLGHPVAWNEKHWAATKAAVDWIQWQLDTDSIFPGKRKDVLYCESESGSYEFYSSYNCLHGIKLSIIMAKELRKKEEIESWTKLYKRLEKGILDNVVDSSDIGPVWHTKGWADHAQKMVHIQLAPDGITYTPLQDYAIDDSITQKYLEIDINSYRYLMKSKNYDCLRMYGYGQGFMTQASLLLDEMNDAENFINLMVTYCYLPRLEGWTAPEGIILHRSGDYWVAVNGYMGQDSHLADSQKALRLMLGIDDNNSEHLRIIPRYPSSWKRMSISDYPVLTGNKRQKISYSYLRNENSQVFRFGFERPVEKMSLRLGPIPEGREVLNATINGAEAKYEKLTSGDSQWVWIRNLSGADGEVKIFYQ